MKFREIKNELIENLEYVDTEAAVLGLVLEKIFRISKGMDVDRIRKEAEIECEREMKNVVSYTQKLEPKHAEEAAQKYAVNKIMIDLIDLALDKE